MLGLKGIESRLGVIAKLQLAKQLGLLWFVLGICDVLLKLIGQANILRELRPNALSFLSKLGSLLNARPYGRGCCKQGNWVDDITPSLWQC